MHGKHVTKPDCVHMLQHGLCGALRARHCYQALFARTCHFHFIYYKNSTRKLCFWSCPSLSSPLMICFSFIHTHFSFFGFSAVSTVISCTHASMS